MLSFKAAVLIYGVGMVFSALDSIITLYRYACMKRQMGVDLLAINQRLRWYVVSKPLLWPWYFMAYKSPLERVSELFFKYYGEEGHAYYGSRGIKNFFNDVVKGKGRYRQYQTTVFCWPIVENSPQWQEARSFFKEQKVWFAAITLARHQETYLLQVVLSNKPSLFSSETVSRFELDQAQKLDKTQLKERLTAINPEKAKAYFASFFNARQ